MKVILSNEEVTAILLLHINTNYTACFDAVEFDGYAVFKTATLFVAEKPPTTVQRWNSDESAFVVEAA